MIYRLQRNTGYGGWNDVGDYPTEEAAQAVCREDQKKYEYTMGSEYREEVRGGGRAGTPQYRILVVGEPPAQEPIVCRCGAREGEHMYLSNTSGRWVVGRAPDGWPKRAVRIPQGCSGFEPQRPSSS